MLEKLSASLRKGLERITRLALVDKGAVESLIRDIQRSLLAADVNVKLVHELSDRIRKKAFEKLPSGLSRKEYLIKLVYEELTNILGKEPAEVELKAQKILLVGLFGSGKTTSTIKLAKFYQKRGLKPCVICADTFRPAAFEQLQQLANKVGVPFYGDKNEKDAAAVVKAGLETMKKYDVIIIDSAGRDALDNTLVREIKSIDKAMQPDDTILVIPADIGQEAQRQAEEFNKALGITSVMVTKLDATGRAGGALTACNVTNAKIKFITVGEKPDDLQIYDPKRFVSRLIGFGDLQSLLEKAKEVTDEKSAEKLATGRFDMNDFIAQIGSVQKVGSFGQIMDMMGMSGAKLPAGALNVQEEKMKKWTHIVKSMTKKERAEPEIITTSRIKRIAKGSGTTEADVRELLKSYKQTKKMTKKLSPKRLEKLAKRGGFGALLKKFGAG